MLRRSISDPVDLHLVHLLDTKQNDLLGRSSFMARMLKYDLASNFHGYPNNPLKRERKALDQSDALHAAEQEEIWNSTDLNLEQKRIMVELLQSKERLMGTNVNLQRALNASEDTNAELEIQKNQLKNQLKSMEKSIKAMEHMRIEMDDVETALAESQMAYNSLKAQNNQLQKENKVLNKHIEDHTNEMSDVLLESKANKKIITDLKKHIKALEKQLEERKEEIEENAQVIMNKDRIIHQQNASLTELTDIGQHLREKIKDLENQLELSLINGGGSSLTQDGTFSPIPTNNHLSLADELAQLSCFETSKRPVFSQVEFDNDIETDGIEEDELLEELFKQGHTQDTKTAILQKAEFMNCVDMVAQKPGQSQMTFPEEEIKPNNNSIPCTAWNSRSFKKAALVTGAVGLGVLVFLKLKA